MSVGCCLASAQSRYSSPNSDAPFLFGSFTAKSMRPIISVQSNFANQSAATLSFRDSSRILRSYAIEIDSISALTINPQTHIYKERDALLTAFSTRRRRMEPRSIHKNAPRFLREALPIEYYEGLRVYETTVTNYSRACYT